MRLLSNLRLLRVGWNVTSHSNDPIALRTDYVSVTRFLYIDGKRLGTKILYRQNFLLAFSLKTLELFLNDPLFSN